MDQSYFGCKYCLPLCGARDGMGGRSGEISTKIYSEDAKQMRRVTTAAHNLTIMNASNQVLSVREVV